jgi:pimeloyl-ACP methyl ester carboxylesterase
LEAIGVPTLFVHAADDRLAPYEHVAPAVERVPHARLVTIDAGGHLFLGHADAVREATTAFIAAVTGPSSVNAALS